MTHGTSPLAQTCVTLVGVRTRLIASPGRGPVVLLLHGYTDSADTWRPVLGLLGMRGRAAAAVDLPCHGMAGPFAGEASLARLDEFVRAAVAHVDRGFGVVVVGNSLGALLALRAADSAVPGANAVLALAPPGTDINLGLRLLPVLAVPLAGLLRMLPAPEIALQAVWGLVYSLATTRGAASAEARRTYAEHLTRDRLRWLIDAGRRIIPEVVAGPSIRALPVPSTVWWGGADIVCPERGASAFDGVGTKVVTPGAPHCPQVVRPELVISLLDALEARAADGARRMTEIKNGNER